MFDDLNICSSNNKHHIKKHKTTSTTKPKMMKYLLIQSFSNFALPLLVDLHNNNNSFLRLKLKSQLKTSTFEKVWKNKSPIISPLRLKWPFASFQQISRNWKCFENHERNTKVLVWLRFKVCCDFYKRKLEWKLDFLSTWFSIKF